MNDNTRQIIAVNELDTGCEEDMHFLWDVWYCLDLSQAQNIRLKSYLDRLVAKDYGQQ